MNKFIEVTIRQTGRKCIVNTSHIVSFMTIGGEKFKVCAIETVVNNGPYSLEVNESYEEVKKMIGETA